MPVLELRDAVEHYGAIHGNRGGFPRQAKK